MSYKPRTLFRNLQLAVKVVDVCGNESTLVKELI